MAASPDGDRSVTVQVVVPPYLEEWLRERAEREGVGMSTFVRMRLIEVRKIELEATAK